jgi:hypothetical protein
VDIIGNPQIASRYTLGNEQLQRGAFEPAEQSLATAEDLSSQAVIQISYVVGAQRVDNYGRSDEAAMRQRLDAFENGAHVQHAQVQTALANALFRHATQSGQPQLVSQAYSKLSAAELSAQRLNQPGVRIQEAAANTLRGVVRSHLAQVVTAACVLRERHSEIDFSDAAAGGLPTFLEANVDVRSGDNYELAHQCFRQGGWDNGSERTANAAAALQHSRLYGYNPDQHYEAAPARWMARAIGGVALTALRQRSHFRPAVRNLWQGIRQYFGRRETVADNMLNRTPQELTAALLHELPAEALSGLQLYQ